MGEGGRKYVGGVREGGGMWGRRACVGKEVVREVRGGGLMAILSSKLLETCGMLHWPFGLSSCLMGMISVSYSNML